MAIKVLILLFGLQIGSIELVTIVKGWADGFCSDKSFGNYPHMDCNKFIQCGPDGEVITQCPGNLHYDVVKKQCNWPKDAGCSFRSSLTTRPTSTKAISSTSFRNISPTHTSSRRLVPSIARISPTRETPTKSTSTRTRETSSSERPTPNLSSSIIELPPSIRSSTPVLPTRSIAMRTSSASSPSSSRNIQPSSPQSGPMPSSSTGCFKPGSTGCFEPGTVQFLVCVSTGGALQECKLHNIETLMDEALALLLEYDDGEP
ncbi:hypothetical protein MAR_024111 [Mya arenaria]|uniref:Chitin-binding type-2 domain-containing protein n=1 Tax=Mya arenaria TaxID=6604 RepID=A0ABY7DRK3_MYAAR|nr:hypothetical protein MAR_024111 [Mya arenaria]